MRSIISLFLIQLALLGNISAWAGGAEAGNGGGISEKYFFLAYLQLDQYIEMCLSLPSCGINVDERKILTDIGNSLRDERTNQQQINFPAKETISPDFFFIDGMIRVAKTGNYVRAPIYINQELLYPKDEDGVIQPRDLPFAITTLVHELGHHHKITDHDMLDQLGQKVANLYGHESATQPIPILNKTATISTILFNTSRSSISDQLIVTFRPAGHEDFDAVLDLTDQIQKSAHCEGSPLSQVIQIKLANPTWKWQQFTQNATQEEFTFPLSLIYSMTCKDDLGNSIQDRGSLDFQLKMNAHQPSYSFSDAPPDMKFTSCLEQGSMCPDFFE